MDLCKQLVFLRIKDPDKLIHLHIKPRPLPGFCAQLWMSSTDLATSVRGLTKDPIRLSLSWSFI